MKTLDEALLSYIDDTGSPVSCVAVADAYKAQGQMAAAMSFYLRAANYSNDSLEQYKALLGVHSCISSLPSHFDALRTLLYHMVSLRPERPEAFYLLCALFADRGDTKNDALAWVEVAFRSCDFDLPIIEGYGYCGKYQFLLKKGHCADWCDKAEEAKELFLELTDHDEMQLSEKEYLLYNLKEAESLGRIFQATNLYRKELYKDLLNQFPGSEGIERNYSESFQDMFVLTMTDGLKEGRYLEIGAGDPIESNNTYLLEKYFGWSGLSIDIDVKAAAKWEGTRRGRISCIDARDVNYKRLLAKLSDEKEYGYLQIDVDSPQVTLEILKSIPFDEYKFACVTIEHDWYKNHDDRGREAIRTYLFKRGYISKVANVSVIGTFAMFEDWFAHPELVDCKAAPYAETLFSERGANPRSLFLR